MILNPLPPPLILGLMVALIFLSNLKTLYHFDYLQQYRDRFKNITLHDLTSKLKGLTLKHFRDFLAIIFPFPAAKLADGSATKESESLRKKIKVMVILIWLIIPVVLYHVFASVKSIDKQPEIHTIGDSQTVSQTQLISEIEKTFKSEEKVKHASVEEWMKADDLEVLATLYFYLTEEDYYLKVDPYLTEWDYFEFIKIYLSRCIKEDRESDMSHSRYSAGYGMMGWFKGYWEDEEVSRELLTEFKQWMAALYKEGDEPIRTAIVHAALEHLFETPEIQTFFSDWKDDPILRDAYLEAKDWGDNIHKIPKPVL
jgi:hypothetical protein